MAVRYCKVPSFVNVSLDSRQELVSSRSYRRSCRLSSSYEEKENERLHPSDRLAIFGFNKSARILYGLLCDCACIVIADL